MENDLEEYYVVTTFSSPSLGPLNKRQSKIRDHFVRTMEFLGLAEVHIDTLTKTQRDEILALAAQRRKELDPSSKKYDPADQSDVNERGSALNKRQWDLRRGLNIKLYKAIDALSLVIHDVEVLTQEQRGIIYAEQKRREKVKKSADQSMVNLSPSNEYQELGKIYTSKPESFVDVSSLRDLVGKPQANLPKKPTIGKSRKHPEVIGAPAELEPPRAIKPKAKGPRKSTALCPQPYKKTFVTKELALAFIDKSHPNDKNIVPYPCPCGAIHIGHKK